MINVKCDEGAHFGDKTVTCVGVQTFSYDIQPYCTSELILMFYCEQLAEIHIREYEFSLAVLITLLQLKLLIIYITLLNLMNRNLICPSLR